jgi:hypothetical protein
MKKFWTSKPYETIWDVLDDVAFLLLVIVVWCHLKGY